MQYKVIITVADAKSDDLLGLKEAISMVVQDGMDEDVVASLGGQGRHPGGADAGAEGADRESEECIMQEFPRRLRELRERRRISRRVLSELCGLSKNMITIYERGEVEPSVVAVVRLADYFDVSADYLLGRKN